MNTKIYRQYEGPWAKKPYPTRGCTVSGAGCGLVALTHIAIEQDRYKNWTPENLRPYMLQHKYAIAGQGTRWEGITQTLKYLGHDRVVRIYNDPMKVAFDELNKGNRIGIILFGSGKAGSSRITWTSCGHYVAFTSYKYENGQHWFYCKDSGGRKHDGWYSYERHMKGKVSKMWIVERVGAQTVSPKATTPDGKLVADGIGGAATVKAMQRFLGVTQDGVISSQNKNLKKYYPALKAVSFSDKPKGSITIKRMQTWLEISTDGILGKQSVLALQNKLGLSNPDGILGPNTMKAWQLYLNAHDKAVYPKPVTPTPTKSWQDRANDWAVDISKQKYHYVRWKSSSKATQTCPICKGRKYNDSFGWNCIGFAYACWHHGGKLENKCNCGVIANEVADKLLKATLAEANKMASTRIGVPVEVIRNKGEAIPLSSIKAGDICMLYKGSKYYHTIYYMGNGKYAESNTTGGIGSSKNIRANLSMSSTAKANLKCAIRYAGK